MCITVSILYSEIAGENPLLPFVWSSLQNASDISD